MGQGQTDKERNIEVLDECEINILANSSPWGDGAAKKNVALALVNLAMLINRLVPNVAGDIDMQCAISAIKNLTEEEFADDG